MLMEPLSEIPASRNALDMNHLLRPFQSICEEDESFESKENRGKHCLDLQVMDALDNTTTDNTETGLT